KPIHEGFDTGTERGTGLDVPHVLPEAVATFSADPIAGSLVALPILELLPSVGLLVNISASRGQVRSRLCSQRSINGQHDTATTCMARNYLLHLLHHQAGVRVAIRLRIGGFGEFRPPQINSLPFQGPRLVALDLCPHN